MKCYICPRNCGADRQAGEVGVCGCPDGIYITRASLHMWEEPPISYKSGSGTVFFSGCNLKCVFCQNSRISRTACGKKVSEDELYQAFLSLKAQGAHNINLVTPTHYTHLLLPVLRRLKEQGFALPVIWNSGGYEKSESIRLLKGLTDIYLPDFKYINPLTAEKYSKAKDYFEYASLALDEMVLQHPTPVIHRGTMRKGVIVRHLILPEHAEESKQIIDYLFGKYGDSIYISIMNQYTPMEQVKSTYPEIYRGVTEREYSSVVEHALKIGVKNAFIQEGGTAEQSFIPDFDCTRI